jgi:hypothetical protein
MLKQDKIDALYVLRAETIRAAEAGELTGLCGRIGHRLNLDRRVQPRIKSALNFWVIPELHKIPHEQRYAADYYWPKGGLEPRIKWIDNQIKLLQNGAKL